MTQIITPEQNLLEKFKNLSPKQQQEALQFIEFLQFHNQQLENLDRNPKNQPISVYDAAKKWIGSVESGMGDLSYNKKYLQSSIDS